MDINKRIKIAIKRSGMTYEQLSQHIGVSRGTISSLASRNYYPSIPTLIKLCKILGMSADYILGLSECEERCENCGCMKRLMFTNNGDPEVRFFCTKDARQLVEVSLKDSCKDFCEWCDSDDALENSSIARVKVDKKRVSPLTVDEPHVGSM